MNNPLSRRVRRRVLAPLLLVAILVAGTSGTPAFAKTKSYVRSALAHRYARVVVSASATVPVTVSAQAGYPAITRAVTVRATVRRSAAGSATLGAWRSARASTPAKARAKARSLAASTARARAKTRAHSIALSRALTAARTAAAAQAKAQATTKAKAAAAAAAAGPCGGEAASVATSKCVFDDEFTGTALDTTKWSPLTSAGSSFSNNYAECTVDSPNNISVSAGTLKLTTRKQDTTACPDLINGVNGTHDTSYTSGSVTSAKKHSWTYGQFSVRAKFPASTVAGLQSSIWMWPDRPNTFGAWPLSGELDIAEEYSVYADRAIPYLHYAYDPSNPAGNLNTNNYCMVNNVNAFHTYTMLWQPGTITIKFDGHTCMTDHYSALGELAGTVLEPLVGGAPFNQPFFMNLTQALGVDTTANAFTPGTTQVPATTEIDYVRVWN